MENDLQIINAKNTFTLTHLKQFMIDLQEDDDIYIQVSSDETNAILTTKSKFFETYWSLKTEDNKEKEVTVASTTKMLIMSEADVVWWQKTEKRKAKLESYMSVEIKEKQTKKTKETSETLRNVAVGTKDSLGHINDISSNYAGTKASIEFINNEIRQRTLTSFFKAEIMICLDYHDDGNDIWKTIDELVVDGQIVLK